MSPAASTFRYTLEIETVQAEMLTAGALWEFQVHAVDEEMFFSAWSKPKNYHRFEFCENGAKATMWR